MFMFVRCLMGKHDWKEHWERMFQSCVKVRTCSRCTFVERDRLQHDWSDWAFPNVPGAGKPARPCHQTRQCRRCSTVETTRDPSHDWNWGSKQYDMSKCERIYTCLRCGEIRRDPNHEWGDWKYMPSYKFRDCTRCGKSEIEDPDPPDSTDKYDPEEYWGGGAVNYDEAVSRVPNFSIRGWLGLGTPKDK